MGFSTTVNFTTSTNGDWLNNVAKKEKNLVKMHNPKLYTLGSFQIVAPNGSVPKLSHPLRVQNAFAEFSGAGQD